MTRQTATLLVSKVDKGELRGATVNFDTYRISQHHTCGFLGLIAGLLSAECTAKSDKY